MRNQLQHMPENGNVMLFALFQLALTAVRSQEAFSVFREKYPGLKEVDLVTFVHIVNCLPNKHVDDCFHLHYLPLINILEKFRVERLLKYLPMGLQTDLIDKAGVASIPQWTEKFPERSRFAYKLNFGKKLNLRLYSSSENESWLIMEKV